MPIVCFKDNKNNTWKRNAKTKQKKQLSKKKKKKQNKGDGSYSERVRDKWLCWAFKFGFLQLICQASPINMSSLSIFSNQYVNPTCNIMWFGLNSRLVGFTWSYIQLTLAPLNDLTLISFLCRNFFVKR